MDGIGEEFERRGCQRESYMELLLSTHLHHRHHHHHHHGEDDQTSSIFFPPPPPSSPSPSIATTTNMLCFTSHSHPPSPPPPPKNARPPKKANIYGEGAGTKAANKKPKRDAPPRPARVRKEKMMSERIAALQELMPVTGKLDRSSILHQALNYIKHLQGQVQELSSAYPPLDCLDVKEGLRSRGLCLVPLSSVRRESNSSSSKH